MAYTSKIIGWVLWNEINETNTNLFPCLSSVPLKNSKLHLKVIIFSSRRYENRMFSRVNTELQLFLLTASLTHWNYIRTNVTHEVNKHLIIIFVSVLGSNVNLNTQHAVILIWQWVMRVSVIWWTFCKTEQCPLWTMAAATKWKFSKLLKDPGPHCVATWVKTHSITSQGLCTRWKYNMTALQTSVVVVMWNPKC